MLVLMKEARVSMLVPMCGVGGAFVAGDGVEGEGDDRQPSSCAERAFLGQIQGSATGAG